MTGGFIEYIFVAFGLSMDAFAVSVSNGICIKNLRFRDGFRSSFFFGAFQFAMPVAGYFAGNLFARYIEAFDHWIAFGLLGFIGAKMIVESLKKKNDACDDDPKGILDTKTLIALSFATSVDALAVGLSYSFLKAEIFVVAPIIGIVTFGVCLAGIEFGKKLGQAFGKWSEVAGGIVLIAIGTKILVEHLAGF